MSSYAASDVSSLSQSESPRLGGTLIGRPTPAAYYLDSQQTLHGPLPAPRRLCREALLPPPAPPQKHHLRDAPDAAGRLKKNAAAQNRKDHRQEHRRHPEPPAKEAHRGGVVRRLQSAQQKLKRRMAPQRAGASACGLRGYRALWSRPPQCRHPARLQRSASSASTFSRKARTWAPRRSHAANPATTGEIFSVCVALQSCRQGSMRPSRHENCNQGSDL